LEKVVKKPPETAVAHSGEIQEIARRVPRGRPEAGTIVATALEIEDIIEELA